MHPARPNKRVIKTSSTGMMAIILQCEHSDRAARELLARAHAQPEGRGRSGRPSLRLRRRADRHGRRVDDKHAGAVAGRLAHWQWGRNYCWKLCEGGTRSALTCRPLSAGGKVTIYCVTIIGTESDRVLVVS